MQLTGKVALITGGGTGIGAAITRASWLRARKSALPAAARNCWSRWPLHCPKGRWWCPVPEM